MKLVVRVPPHGGGEFRVLGLAMAKKKKTDWVEESDFPPPLNAGEELTDQKVMDSWVKHLNNDDPIVGLLTIVQPIGYCEFAINETVANELIQQLREFIAGDSESASGDAADD